MCYPRMLYKVVLPGVLLLLAQILSTAPARAADTCCAITDINTKNGVVSARETATGRQFRFRLTNPVLVRHINVGQGVQADFAAGKVTVVGIDGRYPIIDTAPAATGAKTPSMGAQGLLPGKNTRPTAIDTPPAATGVKSPPAGAQGSLPGKNTRPAAAANKICCTITAVDSRGGVVSARENATGRNFKFVANNKKTLSINDLKPGQGVQADFASKQVSLDGRSACCHITELPAALGRSPGTGNLPPDPEYQDPNDPGTGMGTGTDTSPAWTSQESGSSYDSGQGGYSSGGGYDPGQGSYGSGQGGYGSGGGQLQGDPGGAYGAGQGNYTPGQEGYGSGGGQLQGDRPWYEKEQGPADYGSGGGYGAGQGGYGSGGGQWQGDGNGMGTGTNANPTWTPPPQ